MVDGECDYNNLKAAACCCGVPFGLSPQGKPLARNNSGFFQKEKPQLRLWWFDFAPFDLAQGQ